MITYIYRKGLPTIFSIEKIFDALYSHLERSGVRLFRLELPLVSTGLLSVLRNVWFVARNLKTRVVHITGDVHYAALLCPFRKTIITIHDCVVMHRRTGAKRFALWTLWFVLPVRLASVIVVISEQTKRELLRTVSVPERKVVVIPNFVDPAFTFNMRPFDERTPRIFHVGTTPNKNLSRVIDALRGIPCVLVIVGPLTSREISELRDGGIRYENFVGIDHPQMIALYHGADIISFPSTYEGFGMPILEGQAVGRPVLTSDREPMRSVAGGGGALLVDPESTDSIRNGFLALINDRLLRARVVEAGKDNCRRYTLEAVAASYLQLYRLLGSRLDSEIPTTPQSL